MYVSMWIVNSYVEWFPTQYNPDKFVVDIDQDIGKTNDFLLNTFLIVCYSEHMSA